MQKYNLTPKDTYPYTNLLVKILFPETSSRRSSAQKNLLAQEGLYSSNLSTKNNSKIGQPQTSRKRSVNPKRIKELDLSNIAASVVPNPKILTIFPNLIKLDLSKNKIATFKSKHFSRLLPKLQVLILDHNRISSYNDIRKLELPELKKLSFLGNPVIRDYGDPFRRALENLIWSPPVTIDGKLMKHEKGAFKPIQNFNSDKGVFGKFSELEVFTALYEHVPYCNEGYQRYVIGGENIPISAEEEFGDHENGIIYDYEIEKMRMEKGVDVGYRGGREKREQNPVKILNSLKWIFSVIDKPCPKRKIGRFRALEELNGRVITVYDIFRISGLRNRNDFVQNEIEEKVKKKIAKFEKEAQERAERDKVKLLPRSNKIYTPEYYYNKYNRKKRKEKEKYQPLLYITELPKAKRGKKNSNNPSNYLKLILVLDQTNNYNQELLKEIERKETVKANYAERHPAPPIYLRLQEDPTLKEINAKKEADKRRKEKGQLHYRRALRRVYKFRKWKDGIGTGMGFGGFEGIFGLQPLELLVDFQTDFGFNNILAKPEDRLGDGKHGVIYGARRNKLDEVLNDVGVTLQELKVYDRELVFRKKWESSKPLLSPEMPDLDAVGSEYDMEEEGEVILMDKHFQAHIEELQKRKKHRAKRDRLNEPEDPEALKVDREHLKRRKSLMKAMVSVIKEAHKLKNENADLKAGMTNWLKKVAEKDQEERMKTQTSQDSKGNPKTGRKDGETGLAGAKSSNQEIQSPNQYEENYANKQLKKLFAQRECFVQHIRDKRGLGTIVVKRTMRSTSKSRSRKSRVSRRSRTKLKAMDSLSRMSRRASRYTSLRRYSTPKNIGRKMMPFTKSSQDPLLKYNNTFSQELDLNKKSSIMKKSGFDSGRGSIRSKSNSHIADTSLKINSQGSSKSPTKSRFRNMLSESQEKSEKVKQIKNALKEDHKTTVNKGGFGSLVSGYQDIKIHREVDNQESEQKSLRHMVSEGNVRPPGSAQDLNLISGRLSPPLGVEDSVSDFWISEHEKSNQLSSPELKPMRKFARAGTKSRDPEPSNLRGVLKPRKMIQDEIIPEQRTNRKRVSLVVDLRTKSKERQKMLLNTLKSSSIVSSSTRKVSGDANIMKDIGFGASKFLTPNQKLSSRQLSAQKGKDLQTRHKGTFVLEGGTTSRLRGTESEEDSSVPQFVVLNPGEGESRDIDADGHLAPGARSTSQIDENQQDSTSILKGDNQPSIGTNEPKETPSSDTKNHQVSELSQEEKEDEEGELGGKVFLKKSILKNNSKVGSPVFTKSRESPSREPIKVIDKSITKENKIDDLFNELSPEGDSFNLKTKRSYRITSSSTKGPIFRSSSRPLLGKQKKKKRVKGLKKQSQYLKNFKRKLTYIQDQIDLANCAPYQPKKVLKRFHGRNQIKRKRGLNFATRRGTSHNLKRYKTNKTENYGEESDGNQTLSMGRKVSFEAYYKHKGGLKTRKGKVPGSRGGFRTKNKKKLDFSVGLQKVNPETIVKASQLGCRPTFSPTNLTRKEFPHKIIHKDEPGTEIKFLSPKDIEVKNDRFLLKFPKKKSGTESAARQLAKTLDKNKLQQIAPFKKMVQQTQAAIKNWEKVKNSYYIHETRKESFLKQPKHVISHDMVFDILTKMTEEKEAKQFLASKGGRVPTKDFIGKDNNEFRALYNSINKFQELPNLNLIKAREALKDPNLPPKDRIYIEEFLSLAEYTRSRTQSKLLDNKVLWQKAVQKEFEKKQHDAILAAHYLKLKNYYKDRGYEKHAKSLMKQSFSNYDLSSIRHLKTSKPVTKGIIEECFKTFEKYFFDKNHNKVAKMDPEALDNGFIGDGENMNSTLGVAEQGAKRDHRKRQIKGHRGHGAPRKSTILGASRGGPQSHKRVSTILDSSRRLAQMSDTNIMDGTILSTTQMHNVTSSEMNKEKEAPPVVPPEDFYDNLLWRAGSKLSKRCYVPEDNSAPLEGEFFEENPYIKEKFEEMRFQGVCVKRHKPEKGSTIAKKKMIKEYSNKWAWTFEGELDKANLRDVTIQGELNGMNEEERLLNYAKEFKTRAKQSQTMFQAVNTKLTPGIERKIRDFYKEQKEMTEMINDKKLCMRRFVRQTIDGCED